ncbi:MAG: rod shape-determining protein MreC [Bryobacteraceae bacterium]
MDSLLNRYRNITVLLVAIGAQLVLLGYQVRSDQDVRMIRVWAVTAVTPLARVLESVRSGSAGFVARYILLRDIRDENRRIQSELDRVKMENQFLRTELATADRARALAAFQARTQSRTVAARVIGAGAGTGSKVVFVDRGTAAGVQKGMAVVTPDGIVGKVMAAFPTAAQVLLATDPTFAAGVISQKNGVRGTLRGLGFGSCKVDYVQIEEKIEAGEWFYTSGDDRIFPKGFPVGAVRIARDGSPFKEILVEPAGFQRGLEEVLIILEGVHQQIPEQPQPSPSLFLNPPPPAPSDAAAASVATPTGPGTEADRLRERYRAVGEAQSHKFGEGGPGSKPPDFNLTPPRPQP